MYNYYYTHFYCTEIVNILILVRNKWFYFTLKVSAHLRNAEISWLNFIVFLPLEVLNNMTLHNKNMLFSY